MSQSRYKKGRAPPWATRPALQPLHPSDNPQAAAPAKPAAATATATATDAAATAQPRRLHRQPSNLKPISKQINRCPLRVSEACDSVLGLRRLFTQSFLLHCISRGDPGGFDWGEWTARKVREEKMMVSSFHDGPSQASTMHMPVPMEGFHNAEPTPNAGHSYQYSQHHQQQRRKRKAETQDAHNERLSKRLSLLNLEQNGSKLYVPVEQPAPSQSANNASSSSSSPSAAAIPGAAVTAGGDEMMLLDDTKHKVYIYNLDDELSSDADSDPDDARLVFLPDIERHLRANRIVPGIPGSSVPRPILPNKDGELAGMQLVLYDDGVRSVSVPEEQDSVRKAIIEARERHRRRQQDERDARAAANNPLLRPESRATFATPVKVAPGQLQQFADDGATGMASSGADVDVDVGADAPADGDADAMEID